MKKIAIFSMVTALLLVGVTTTHALESSETVLICESITPFFSDIEKDYSVGIDLDKAEGKYSIIFYGRLKSGHNFNELITTFKDKGYSFSSEDKSKFGTQIENEKMLIYGMGTGVPQNYILATDCKAIAKKKPSDRPPFACIGEQYQLTDMSKDEEALLKDLPDTHKARYRIADVCRSRAPYLSLAKLASNSLDDGDEDKDGIPNSFDSALSVDIPGDTPQVSTEPAEETTSPSDVSDLSDTSEPSTPLTADAPTEVMPSIPRWYDKGGACNMVPNAAANPFSYLLIAAALGILVCRKMK